MTAAPARVHYEVVLGDGEHDRQLYVDYGDGSFISQDADVRAARFFLELATARRRCGLWVNGRLVAGEDVTTKPDAVVEHKTSTVADATNRHERYRTKSNGSCGRWVRTDESIARCTCGWRSYEDTRAEARAAARAHRAGTEAVAP